jgi:hypothetical protein
MDGSGIPEPLLFVGPSEAEARSQLGLDGTADAVPFLSVPRPQKADPVA